MTEGEWLACADPMKLMSYLAEGTGSDRQLRLYGCACARWAWDLLTEDCFRNAVEVAERFADGEASVRELALAKQASGAALERHGRAGMTGPAYSALDVAWSCTRNPQTAAMFPMWVFTDEAQREFHLLLIREIWGNPFRPRTVDRRSATAVALARGIYADRAFGRLPILGDALEDEGCTDAALLAHCRGGGEHVRGCWAVDLLLDKK
jgi:hypothetical protein